MSFQWLGAFSAVPQEQGNPTQNPRLLEHVFQHSSSTFDLLRTPDRCKATETEQRKEKRLSRPLFFSTATEERVGFVLISSVMQIPRWRNALVLKSSLVPAFLPSKQTATVATTHVASFHCTPVTCEKWKNKWNFDVRSTQQPTKNYVRYVVRQKRADTKRALKDLLLNNGSPDISFEDEDPLSKFDGTESGNSDGFDKKRRSRFSRRQAGKSNHKKVKRRFRRESFSEDFDHPETIFEATFGNKWYTWSSRGDSSFQKSESGFQWREQSGRANRRTKFWETISDAESEDESYEVGSCSDRTILGLPPRGPLKVEDVKNAYRLSALKWHPDKHQGPSQAMAEEKFKLCVKAYKSLCNALA